MKKLACLLLIALAGCAAPEQPMQITPPGEIPGAAVVRRPLPEPSVATPSPPGVAPAPGRAAQPASPPIAVPANLLYVCVSDVAGERKQVGIQFTPKVHELCSRHPEMGPCQYEREACRHSGGRVFAAGGQEITRAVETEYDRKVMRVRFRAN